MGGRHHDGAGRDDIPGHRAAALSRLLLLCLLIQRGRRSLSDRCAWLAWRDDDRWPPNGSEGRERLTCEYRSASVVERTDERWWERDHDVRRDVVARRTDLCNERLDDVRYHGPHEW